MTLLQFYLNKLNHPASLETISCSSDAKTHGKGTASVDYEFMRKCKLTIHDTPTTQFGKENDDEVSRKRIEEWRVNYFGGDTAVKCKKRGGSSLVLNKRIQWSFQRSFLYTTSIHN